jgi:Escherichia/Staphylococcus phage prohead protease
MSRPMGSCSRLGIPAGSRFARSWTPMSSCGTRKAQPGKTCRPAPWFRPFPAPVRPPQLRRRGSRGRKYVNRIERRFLAPAELRADVDGRRLVGYAARYNIEADIGGMFFETIRPGAFRASLAGGDDIAALADHDQTRLLGRRSSGSLSLKEDPHGLAFEISVPDTSIGNDMLTLARRNDLAGMSFGFTDAVDAWPDPKHRELRSVTLIEISVISGGRPAYPQTSVAARAARRTRAKTSPDVYEAVARFLRP